MTTPVLGLPTYTSGVASFVELNIQNRLIEAIATGTVLGNLSEPTGSEADGARYIVQNGSGIFSGKNNDIAVNINGAWYFISMSLITEGTRVFDQSISEERIFTGSSWVAYNPPVYPGLTVFTDQSILNTLTATDDDLQTYNMGTGAVVNLNPLSVIKYIVIRNAGSAPIDVTNNTQNGIVTSLPAGGSLFFFVSPQTGWVRLDL